MAEEQAKTSPVALAGYVVLLIVTQMIMLIFGKKATTEAKLPLVLCITQFLTSSTLAGLASLAQGRGLPWMPRELWWIIAQLSAVWTAGFVLFNASATHMSPGYVNLIRCAEPLVTVTLGLLMGTRYSLSVLATLIPICGGVALASFKGGIPSTVGVALAMCSNACFCGRPFFKQQLKQSKANKVRLYHIYAVYVHSLAPSTQLDSIGEFYNITLVAVVMLPPFVFAFEGSEASSSVSRLTEAGALGGWSMNVLLSR